MRNPEIEEVFVECAEIVDKKNTDYATTDDFYANFRLVEEIGLPMWVGVVIRYLDKFSRLKGFTSRFVNTGKLHLENENIEDTFIDAINYMAIALVTYRKWYKQGGSFDKRPLVDTDNNDVSADVISNYSKCRND